MKHFSYSLVLAFVAISMFGSNSMAQASTNVKNINQVFKGKKLANGTPLIPDASINKNSFLKQYNANKPLWDKAFDYLKKTNLDSLPAGRYTIDGDSVYAIVLDGPTKTPEQAKWESHLTYIDFQCVLKGAEMMEVTPINTATVTTPYNPKTDNINYSASGTAHLAEPGHVLLFFPDEVHRAGLKADGFDRDKRIVIKIMMSDK